MQNIRDGEITEEMFSSALRALPQLNFSKFAEKNIETLRYNGLFRGNAKDSMYFSFIADTIKEIESNALATFPTELVARTGQVVFIIDDTSELFPEHSNAYAFEGIIKDYVAPEKIVGIVMINQGYKPYLEEFVKFVGIPLYDAEGKIIWPQ